ncbi:LamG domain-containing protein, partial [bacterium]|nr:LamG domain-containing protein [bacterium]
GDLSKWDLSDKEAGSVVEIVSETLHILGYANQRAKVYTDNIGCSDNFMMTMKARPKAAAASGIYSFPSLTDGTNTLAHADWKSWNGNELRVFNGGTPSAYDMPKDSWYDIKITADQTNKTFDYYVNDVLKSNDFNTYSGSYSGTLNTIYFSAGASGNGGEAYIDNVIVCKYASPEPSAGAPGSEQIESSNQIILQKQGAYSLQTNGDGTQVYGFLNGNRLTASVPVPQLDEWHHYVLTYNRDKQILYINGEESAQTNFSEAINTNTDNLIIGEIFSGSIDEVRIYNKALSEDEIENLYEFGMGTLISDPYSEAPVFTPDTIGVYHIDLTVTDSYGGF